jgi:hypothetical protein
VTFVTDPVELDGVVTDREVMTLWFDVAHREVIVIRRQVGEVERVDAVAPQHRESGLTLELVKTGERPSSAEMLPQG